MVVAEIILQLLFENVLGAFNKPSNWMDCKDYLWIRKSKDIDIDYICLEINKYQDNLII